MPTHQLLLWGRNCCLELLNLYREHLQNLARQTR